MCSKEFLAFEWGKKNHELEQISNLSEKMDSIKGGWSFCLRGWLQSDTRILCSDVLALRKGCWESERFRRGPLKLLVC